jgi:hypothetical protein
MNQGKAMSEYEIKNSLIANEVNEQVTADKKRCLAEAVRAACVKAALEGYERAAISGLCHEGAWECAVDAIRALNLETVIKTLPDNDEQNS